MKASPAALVDVSKRTADEERHERPAAAPPAQDPVIRVDKHLVSLVAPNSIEAEQYRSLRYVVEHMRKPGEEGGTMVGVCSPVSGDGKSVTAINLAGSLAQDPKARVL